MAKQKKQNNRDDFTPTTVTKLGKRVGFICSNPACRIHTVGPNEASDKTSNIGKAAHICAAAENGPRYDPKMTPAQRSGIDNGIWLCGNCHDIVDADPVRYPADLLRQWKADAENAASNRLGKPVENTKNLRQFPLQAPAIPLLEFVPGSRDTELEALRASLENENVVFLWGFGGMGKTETAIKLAHGIEPSGGVFMMHYQNSMRETILKLTFENYKLYATPATNTPETFADADYRQRMKMLKEGYHDAILIVDNFDVEGKTLAELQSEPAYQELVTSGIKLIFTTRNPVNRPDWEINQLSRNYQLQLMRSHAPDISIIDEDLLSLIDAVDGHTLTLALMAKTLNESWGDVTPAQMLDALRNSSWEELESPDVSSDKDRDKTQRRIEAHLTALFDLSKLSDDARTVLACATLLPDSGMKDSMFRQCLTSEQKKSLMSLTKNNWLGRKEGLLTIHAVMRQVCRITLKPNDMICGAFLEELWKQYDNKDYNEKQFRQIAECFAIATDTLGSTSAWYSERSGFLFHEIAHNDFALVYCQNALTILKKNDPGNVELMGIILNDIALAYNSLGNFAKALEFNKLALSVRLASLPADHPGLARSYDNIGGVYLNLAEYHKALEYQQQALNIRLQVHPEDHHELGISYDNIGTSYNKLGETHKALKYKQRALEIFQRSLPEDHPDLARSYNNVGATYGDLGKNQIALVYHRKALDIRQRVLSDNHPDLANSFYNVGFTYCVLNQPKKGYPLLMKARYILENALPPGHPDLTLVYNTLKDFHATFGSAKEVRHYHHLVEENKFKEPK